MKAILIGGPALKRVYNEASLKRIRDVSGEEPLVCDGKPESFVGGPGNQTLIPPDCEAIFSTWGMPQLTTRYIKENLPDLKYVFYGAGSVQSFARPFLENGVRVFSAWQANGVPVAEFTVAQTVLCGKRYFDVITGAHGSPHGNYGLKVGVIGLGTIGRLVCKMLGAYNYDIFAFDKFLPDAAFAGLNVKKADLETIFSECDVITNHLADNPATKGMLNRSLLSSMKKDAAFINTGRGAQVDNDALYDALKESPERTALLDVTYPEPLPPGHRLLTLKNAIVSPHIAGSLGDEVSRMGEYMCDEFERVANGEKPLFEVTEELLEVMA